MGGPKHLWAGDWERDSSEAADELADRHPYQPREREPAQRVAGPAPAPGAAPDAAPRRRPVRAARGRRLNLAAALRRGRRPAGAIVLLAVIAVGAYAGVSALLGSSGDGGRGRAWLGVEMSSSPVLAGGFQSGFGGFPFAAGAAVTVVYPGGPAAAAGIVPGDVIIQIGQRPVQTAAQVDAAIAPLRAGDRVQLEYAQGPLTYTTTVTLGTRPASSP
jgi:PDZ domain